MRGEFKGWTKEARDTYVASLYPVIGKHKITSFAVAVRNEEATACLLRYPLARQVFGTPYRACLVSLMSQITKWANGRVSGAKISIFHEKNDFYKEVYEATRIAEEVGIYKKNEIRISFLDSKGCLPLEAADILAYESFKRVSQPERPRLSWDAIDESRSKTELSMMSEAEMEPWFQQIQLRGPRMDFLQ